MYYSRRKPLDEIPQELTLVWSCTNDKCNGWIRDNFSFSNQPICPQCQSAMAKTEKMITVIANTSPNSSKK
ncbi:cold-shock protein [Paenibacillus oceani]|uniref:Cold-shock protein n=1 Tax=Paenibacillus oceani TaxID=2772510 RepID=A0A927CBG1_9BACL|nr:cold-shock protein [Paenibacillus oceani]MBD2864585.1 cold-shock protein [Paenibacillus oceani]